MLKKGRVSPLLVAIVLSFCSVVRAQTPGYELPEVFSASEERETLTGQGSPVTLDGILREAVEKNPSIQASQQSVASKKARIVSEQALPEPMLSFQSMGNIIPPTLQKGDPSSGRIYSIQQDFPFPGKRGLKGQIASAEAESEVWNLEQTRRQVLADLKKAFYDYYYVHKAMAVVHRDMELLQNFTEVAESKYQVGQGAQQDVIRSQVEVSKQRDRLAVLEQRREILAAQINSLLYRTPDSPLGPPADFKKSELIYSLDELTRLAEHNAPAIKMQEQEISRGEYTVQLARREYYPDFALGFSYVERDDMPEMYGLMVSAKIPLYYWEKQRPELESARLSLAGARKQRDNTTSTVAYKLRDSYITVATSQKLIQLYDTTLIPQSRISLESAFAGYQVGAVDFLTLVDNLITLRDYELKYYESLTEFQKALAQLEAIVGVNIAIGGGNITK